MHALEKGRFLVHPEPLFTEFLSTGETLRLRLHNVGIPWIHMQNIVSAAPYIYGTGRVDSVICKQQEQTLALCHMGRHVPPPGPERPWRRVSGWQGRSCPHRKTRKRGRLKVLASPLNINFSGAHLRALPGISPKDKCVRISRPCWLLRGTGTVLSDNVR